MLNSPLVSAMRPWMFHLSITLAVAMVVLRAVALGQTMDQTFATAGNDEIMRLMSVRNLLAGQAWFDMYQHRILPPEGISLHWSRYVDAGIALVIWALAQVTSMPTAEHLGSLIWPGLLHTALILVVGFGTRRLLGVGAASIAVLCVVFWPVISQNYFGPGRLDHHNVQILMMTVVAFAVFDKAHPFRGGAVAGIASAFSLAVGLESLFFIAAVGVLLILRGALGGEDAKQRLIGFCIAISVASVVFFIGQTPASAWATPQCDKLSTPFLAISVLGSLSGLSFLALPARWRQPAVIIGAAVAVVGVGLAVIWPLLQPCLAGPYAALPSEIQAIINDQISEARPAFHFARKYPYGFNAFVTPALSALVIATLVWLRNRMQAANTSGKDVVAQLLWLGWVGMAACLIQIRLVLLVAPVVPILTGYALMALIDQRAKGQSLGATIAVFGAICLTLLAPSFNGPAQKIITGFSDPAASSSAPQSQGCRGLSTIAKLNKLPPALILTEMNLGPRLILMTHHDGLSSPYHRSGEAMYNGLIPFNTDVATMQSVMRNYDASYLAVCRNTIYGNSESIGSQLAAGATVDWLDPLAIDDAALMVFAVKREP